MPSIAQSLTGLRTDIWRALDLATRLDEQIATGGLMSDRAIELGGELDDALLRVEIGRRAVMERQPLEGLRRASESLPKTLHVHGQEVPLIPDDEEAFEAALSNVIDLDRKGTRP